MNLKKRWSTALKVIQITLAIMPSAIQPARIGKPCCNLGPEKRTANALPSSMPAIVPAQKGKAIGHCMASMSIADTTLVAEISEVIASEIANMDNMGRLGIFLSVGTITNPLPTPSRPDRNPVVVPDNADVLKQGIV